MESNNAQDYEPNTVTNKLIRPMISPLKSASINTHQQITGVTVTTNRDNKNTIQRSISTQPIIKSATSKLPDVSLLYSKLSPKISEIDRFIPKINSGLGPIVAGGNRRILSSPSPIEIANRQRSVKLSSIPDAGQEKLNSSTTIRGDIRIGREAALPTAASDSSGMFKVVKMLADVLLRPTPQEQEAVDPVTIGNV